MRASTCLQPCRALSCPTIARAMLFPLFPTGSYWFQSQDQCTDQHWSHSFQEGTSRTFSDGPMLCTESASSHNSPLNRPSMFQAPELRNSWEYEEAT